MFSVTDPNNKGQKSKDKLLNEKIYSSIKNKKLKKKSPKSF